VNQLSTSRLIRGAIAGSWQFRRTIGWIGGGLVAACLLSTLPFHLVVSKSLGHSALASEALSRFPAEALVDLIAHHRAELGTAEIAFLLFTLLLFPALIVAGSGALEQALRGDTSLSVEEIAILGLRRLRRSLGILAGLSLCALPVAVLLSLAKAGIEKWAELALMDDRVDELFSAGVFAVAFAVAMILRAVWDASRIEAFRFEKGAIGSLRNGIRFVMARPFRSMILEGTGAIAGAVIFLASFFAASSLHAITGASVAIQWSLLALGVFFFPGPRVGVMASFAEWHRTEKKNEEPKGAIEASAPPVEAVEPGEAITDEYELTAPLPTERSSEPGIFDPPGEKSSAGAAVDMAAMSPRGDPFDLPNEKESLARPSKEITLPLAVTLIKKPVVAKKFPQNLPKGIGIEVMSISPAASEAVPVREAFAESVSDAATRQRSDQKRVSSDSIPQPAGNENIRSPRSDPPESNAQLLDQERTGALHLEPQHDDGEPDIDDVITRAIPQMRDIPPPPVEDSVLREIARTGEISPADRLRAGGSSALPRSTEAPAEAPDAPEPAGEEPADARSD